RDFHVTGVQTCALPILILLQGWPEEWLRIYVSSGHLRRDPVVAMMRRKPHAFRWREAFECEALAREGKVVIGQAREFGLIDGIRSEERRVGEEWRARAW